MHACVLCLGDMREVCGRRGLVTLRHAYQSVRSLQGSVHLCLGSSLLTAAPSSEVWLYDRNALAVSDCPSFPSLTGEKKRPIILLSLFYRASFLFAFLLPSSPFFFLQVVSSEDVRRAQNNDRPALNSVTYAVSSPVATSKERSPYDGKPTISNPANTRPATSSPRPKTTNTHKPPQELRNPGT